MRDQSCTFLTSRGCMVPRKGPAANPRACVLRVEGKCQQLVVHASKPARLPSRQPVLQKRHQSIYENVIGFQESIVASWNDMFQPQVEHPSTGLWHIRRRTDREFFLSRQIPCFPLRTKTRPDYHFTVQVSLQQLYVTVDVRYLIHSSDSAECIRKRAEFKHPVHWWETCTVKTTLFRHTMTFTTNAILCLYESPIHQATLLLPSIDYEVVSCGWISLWMRILWQF